MLTSLSLLLVILERYTAYHLRSRSFTLSFVFACEVGSINRFEYLDSPLAYRLQPSQALERPILTFHIPALENLTG